MKKRKEKLKYSFKTLEYYPAKDHCHYSGLPSPLAYVEDKKPETMLYKFRYKLLKKVLQLLKLKNKN